MYGSTTNTHREKVSKTTDTRTLKLLSIGSAQGSLTQTTVQTVETWAGLSQSDAESLMVSSETSIKDGVTRPYLGGVRIYVGSTAARVWTTVETCWGTRVNTSMQRVADTNLYSVQRTTTELSIDASGCESVVLL